MGTLGDADRSWVVAGLRARGMTVDEVAARLKCNRRLVLTVMNSPLTAVCLYAQTETHAFGQELHLRDSALRAVEAQLVQAVADRDRYRRQRDNLIDAQIVGAAVCRRCGTPWDAGNTYECQGKRYCRECNRRKQKALREQKAAARRQAGSASPDASPVTEVSVTVS